MDEEALKHNTDCVYFLASPLTCKKGINCEFRHSEAARLHPRDCWYWLGGNCLNAKCPYRHPPLDGRPASVSASAPAPLVPSKATLVPSASMVSSSPANKYKTPCFFFLQGYCSKGKRCLFLHESMSSTTAQPAVQKLPEESPGKGRQTYDKPMNKVEGISPSIHVSSSKSAAGTSTVRTLPSHVYVRAHKTPVIDNVAPPSGSSKKASSANCLNVETSIVKIDLDDRGHFVQHTPDTNFNLPNLADLCDTGVHKAQLEEQPKCADELWSEVRSAEVRQLSQAEGISKARWRERQSKDVRGSFIEDEFGDAFDREGKNHLPHFIGGAHSPGRKECYEDAHESGQAGSESYGIAVSPDADFDDWDEHLFCQQNLSNSRRRNFSPCYLARGDGYKIQDLREHLGKRRSSYQDQFSGFDGHVGVFEDHVHSDERNWADSMESALRESERETPWRKCRRTVHRRIQPPDYNYGWDGEMENAEVPSAMPPPMHLTRYFPRSKPYSSGGGLYSPRRARWLSEFDCDRSLQTRLRSRVNVEEGETHSDVRFSCVSRPSIKSRILSAGSDNGQVDDFEGPKPLNVLLQEKRKVN